MTQQYLNICHWNIGGLNVKNDSLCKLNSDALKQLVNKHDIICLSETHCGEEQNLAFNGYNCFKLCRKLNTKINRFFGGIAILYKNELKNGIKFLTHKNDDYVWIKFCKHFFGTKEDYYICYAYIPPENSTYYQKRQQDTWEYIENDIAHYSNRGYVVICGDLNARTGINSDYIKQDEESRYENLLYYEIDEIHPRNSQDRVICSRGRRILETCISANLRIVNGRKIGDGIGRYTCHKINGSSTIDYLIVSQKSYKNIPFMKINKFSGDISDHCSLSWAMLTNRQLFLRKPSKNMYNEFPRKFNWSSMCINKFQEHLLNSDSTKKIEKLLHKPLNSKLDVEMSTLGLQQILQEAGRAAIPHKNIKTVHKNSKKWFDNSLKDLKKSVLLSGTAFQNNPYNTSLRKCYFETLTKYNKLKKRKAREYKSKLIKQLNELRTSNPSHYWKLLKQLKENNSNESTPQILVPEWELYFKNLNTSNKINDEVLVKLNILEKQKYFNPTDYIIKESEISKCIKVLKNKKSPGLDGILNEMIRYSQSALLPVLTKIFNNILGTGNYPDTWRTAYIIPIFKKGDVMDTNNYRGITIISNIAKLFNMVIQNRLSKFFMENNLINEKQIAFNKGSRTSDHLFVIKTLVDKYLDKSKKLYTCFVDFRKAFDSINHVKLLYKLRQTNIGSLAYNILKDMYLNKKNNLQVKVGNLLSQKFSSNIGIKQGDPISPILFNFYIDELKNYLKTDKDTPIMGSKLIHYLLWADDLVLMSTSKEGLQNLLNGLQDFCKDWDMEVNTSKTQILIFRKTLKPIQEKFLFNKSHLKSVTTYKYLGTILQSNGKIAECTKDLYHRSLKAMFKLTRSFNTDCPDFNTCIHLFDHLVKPILTYNAEIWGPSLLKGKSINFEKLLAYDIEKCHIKFLRFAVGINKRAPIVGIYGETGRFPIIFEILRKSINYFNRLIDMNDDTILSECLTENFHLKRKDSWLTNLKSICENIPITLETVTNKSYLNEGNIKSTILSQFKIWWHNKLFNDTNTLYGNKLRNYRTYKNYFIKEEYLSVLTYKPYRSSLAQLRLSCHKLFIETGRYAKKENRLPPAERLCKFCSLGVCEDEYHFIMKCELYNSDRENLLNNIKKLYPSTSDLDSHALYMWLMANLDTKIIQLLAKFVYKSFKTRNSKKI